MMEFRMGMQITQKVNKNKQKKIQFKQISRNFILNKLLTEASGHVNIFQLFYQLHSLAVHQLVSRSEEED